MSSITVVVPRSSRFARRTAVLTALFVLLLSARAMSATWTPQAPPAPTGGNAQLTAVSCPSTGSCLAVGYDVNALGQQHAAIESWNGSAWSVTFPGVPAGAIQSYLSGVSCTAATACTVVGSYAKTAGGKIPFTERWNGTKWTVQTVPLPSGTSLADLNAVACTGATACTAVGSFGTSNTTGGTLIEAWNGTSWALQSSPNPAGAADTTLNGISCHTACMAVGDFTTATGGLPAQPVAEQHTSAGWQVVPMPAPAGTSATWLTGISCTAANACMAAGGDAIGGGPYPNATLAERWNGTAWTISPTPAEPPSNPQGIFSSVSCASATSCLAVGAPSYYGSGTAPLAEAYNGTGWTVQSAPNPPNHHAWLWGAACTSGGCTTVGGQSFEGPNGSGLAAPLAEQFSSTGTWTITPTPEGAGPANAQLDGATCLTGPSCTAVGFFNDPATPGWLVDSWNGTNWTMHSGSLTAAGGALQGVACTAPTQCTTVGYAGSPIKPLALTWNGSTWARQSVPAPTGASQALLYSVTCTSSSACVAVGYYTDGSTFKTLSLLEQWNGATWRVVSVPEPPGVTRSQLSSVSCASGRCIAVGQYSTSSTDLSDLPFVEVTSGTGWALATNVPVAPGAMYTALNGVSCATGPACTVVGGYSTSQTSYADTALALKWDGSSWTTESPQIPSIGPFVGTSCGSATACQAVSYYDAEGWDGTSWSLESGLASGDYLGVGCNAASQCLAVGANPSGISVTQTNLFAGLSLASNDVVPVADSISGASAAPSGAVRAVASAPRDREVIAASGS